MLSSTVRTILLPCLMRPRRYLAKLRGIFGGTPLACTRRSLALLGNAALQRCGACSGRFFLSACASRTSAATASRPPGGDIAPEQRAPPPAQELRPERQCRQGLCRSCRGRPSRRFQRAGVRPAAMPPAGRPRPRPRRLGSQKSGQRTHRCSHAKTRRSRAEQVDGKFGAGTGREGLAQCAAADKAAGGKRKDTCRPGSQVAME